jgi:hypothetical protein
MRAATVVYGFDNESVQCMAMMITTCLEHKIRSSIHRSLKYTRQLSSVRQRFSLKCLVVHELFDIHILYGQKGRG